VAVIGDLKGTAPVQVVPAGLSLMVVKPDGVTATAGDKQLFTIEGFDPFANSLGDLTSFAGFSIAPDGQCAANGCIATKAGLHTVTAVIGAIKGTAAVQLVPGPITQLGLRPADAETPAGQALAFAVDGLDQFGNKVADLTDKAVFSMSDEGRCDINQCGSVTAGTYTVTGVVGK